MKSYKNKIIIISLTIILAVAAGLVVSMAVDYNNAFDASLKELKDLKVSNTTQQNTEPFSETESISTSITADELIDNINIGINIGNSLDCCPVTGINDGNYDTSYYETLWGNPVITSEYIHCLKDAGFTAVRLPVTWYYNTYKDGGKLMIRSEWLDRVAEIIDYIIECDMYVILDSHHDEYIIWADMNDIDEVSSNVKDLWSQISERFSDYDNHLIFEGFNEIKDKNKSWKYNDSSAKATNILNQVFVDTVRSSGKNNADRILICGTYLNEVSDDVLNSFSLPNDTIDNKLIVSLHSYDASYNQDIKSLFEKFKKFSKKTGAPVIISEFGTNDSFVPAEYRSNHAGNYIACAEQYDIKCFWWDDGGSYKLFDRKNNEVFAADIIDSLMNPAEFKTKKVSSNIFNSIESYSYAAISPQTGDLVDFPDGALTLNLGMHGLPVIYGYGYHIKLSTTGKGDGLRLLGLAFYDSHKNFIEYQPIDGTMSYDVTPPQDASYMRITFYNPWGYRSSEDYISYLEKEELILEITEYIKTTS